MLMGEAEDVWKPLLRQGLCESVVGFEPNAEECRKLNDDAKSRSSRGEPACEFRFLASALGNGARGEFRLCSAPMTSSMLEPNAALLERFTQLKDVTTVVKRSEVQTRRLDDLLPEMPGCTVDFLKLDVQGYELAVLE